MAAAVVVRAQVAALQVFLVLVEAMVVVVVAVQLLEERSLVAI